MSAPDNTYAAADGLSQDAQQRLKAIIEQIEASNARKAEEAEHCKSIYETAKGQGYDTKILRKVIKALSQDRARREQEDAVLATYLVAVGAA